MSRIRSKEKEMRRTKRRTVANTKQKTRGPARSASSMICGSTVLKGLRTVKLFCKM